MLRMHLILQTIVNTVWLEEFSLRTKRRLTKWLESLIADKSATTHTLASSTTVHLVVSRCLAMGASFPQMALITTTRPRLSSSTAALPEISSNDP